MVVSYLNEIELAPLPQDDFHRTICSQFHYPPPRGCINPTGGSLAPFSTKKASNLPLTNNDRTVSSMKLPQQLDATKHARQHRKVSIPRSYHLVFSVGVDFLAPIRRKGYLREPLEKGLWKGKSAGARPPTAANGEFRSLYNFFVGNGVEIKSTEGLTAVCCECAIQFPLADGVEKQRQVGELRRISKAAHSLPLDNLHNGQK